MAGRGSRQECLDSKAAVDVERLPGSGKQLSGLTQQSENRVGTTLRTVQARSDYGAPRRI